MTIDEAIKHAEEVAEEKQHKADNLKQCKDYGNPKSTITSGVVECETCADEHRQLAEWLKDYKRLLEQEPCEDCVSRKRLMDNYNGVETPVGYRKVVDFEVIKNMPSVTPTRKKGKWIKQYTAFVNNYNQIVTECHCTNCYGISYFRSMNGELVGAKYCPNCGAEMENVENDK